jgi:ABC-type polysaccharide/polyol phosphate transport system ATPase subunit
VERVGDLALIANRVSVQYDLRLTRDRTLRRTLAERFRGENGADSKFWAIRDVSFAIRDGDVLGVIGRNGSGKSTLLLALAGILRPDLGAVQTFGLKPTLLTLTTGFETDLSGRQNIFIAGAYFGFGRAKMAERVDEIIEFSDLGPFIDAPIRTYSSGMRARLAFSIAAYVEPQILLIDELLGVGDASFSEKSKAKIRELMNQAHAIVIVSHSANFIRKTCNRALWLSEGRIAGFGEPPEVVNAYIAATEGTRAPLRALS